jgi:hypothetical protein
VLCSASQNSNIITLQIICDYGVGGKTNRSLRDDHFVTFYGFIPYLGFREDKDRRCLVLGSMEYELVGFA